MWPDSAVSHYSSSLTLESRIPSREAREAPPSRLCAQWRRRRVYAQCGIFIRRLRRRIVRERPRLHSREHVRRIRVILLLHGPSRQRWRGTTDETVAISVTILRVSSLRQLFQSLRKPFHNNGVGQALFPCTPDVRVWIRLVCSSGGSAVAVRRGPHH